MKKIVFFIAFLFAFFLPLLLPVVAIGEKICPGEDASSCIPAPQTKIKEIKQYNKAKEAYEKNGTLSSYQFQDQTLDGVLTAIIAKTAPSLAGTAVVDGGGAYGFLTKSIADIFEAPPASAKIYVADLLQNMNVGLAQPAYAQGAGLGFTSLSPILAIWKVFRDLAYFAFIILFMVVGFTIMFRQKVGGQAAVTAQQALPQIIVALLTVTFSYAIAGLLIDGMYLIMFMLIATFPGSNAQWIQGNAFQVMWGLVTIHDVAGSGGQALSQMISEAFNAPILNGGITSLAAAVVIILVIVFQMFKLFFGLLRIYFELILTIAFAPITLMMGALPGQNPFWQWLKNIYGNLAVFPMILLLILIFDTIKEYTNLSGTGGFMPPYVGSSGETANTALLLASLCVIMALSKVPDEVPKAMGVNTGGLLAGLIREGMANFRKRSGVVTAPAKVLGGAAVGAGVGAGAGLAYAAWRKKPVRDSMKTGAIMGGLAGPVLATKGPGVITNLAGAAVNQGLQAVTTRYVNYNIEKFRGKIGEQRNEGDKEYLHEVGDQIKKHPQTTSAGVTPASPKGKTRPTVPPSDNA